MGLLISLVKQFNDWAFHPSKQAEKHKGWAHPIFAFTSILLSSMFAAEYLSKALKHGASNANLPDGLRFKAGYFLLGYYLFMFFSRFRIQKARVFYDMMWACNVSMLIAIFGLLKNNSLMVGSSIVIIAIDQLLWWVDVLSYLFTKKFKVGVAGYLLWPETHITQKISSTHHLWFIPLCGYIVKQSVGLENEAYIISAIVTIILFINSRLFVPKVLEDTKKEKDIYMNVNLSWELWKDVKIGWLKSLTADAPFLKTCIFTTSIWNALNFGCFLLLRTIFTPSNKIGYELFVIIVTFPILSDMKLMPSLKSNILKAMSQDERFVFLVEWYDSAASLIRTYHLTYFPADKTIEMFDLKNKKTFLKRCEYPSITINDLYIGSVVTVYSRQLKIVDYADLFTRQKFEVKRGRTFAMIKPDAYTAIGKIIDLIEKSGFVIGNIKMAKLTVQDAEEFYAEHKVQRGKPFFNELISFVTSDFVVGMELVSDDCIKRWRSVIGPTNCQIARVEAPNSIRAIFGSEGVRNAVHGSDSAQSADREINFFFGEKSKIKTTALFNNCTCAIIKPHIVMESKVGRVIDHILNEGFEVSALQMFFLDRATAEEFFEVYRGVLPEFSAMANHLTNGPCIALEVRQEDAVNAFRQICGPHDPELAKTLRPNTIRAKYGIDRVKNAIHCTDLPEDGVLEVEYFFNILQQK